MEDKKKTCPYCGEEILAVAKKCKFCGEWLGEGNEDNAAPTQDPAEGKTTSANQNAPVEAKKPVEQQQAEKTETPEEESKETKDKEKDNIQGMAGWFFILAAIGTLVSTAYEEGFSLMSFDDIHGPGVVNILRCALVLAGKLPLWVGNAASVLGECGLFILLYALLKRVGTSCKQTLVGIALGCALVSCADPLSLMVTDEGDEMAAGLFALMAVVVLMVCLVIFGIKAIKNKDVCDFKDDAENYLNRTGIMCLVFIALCIVSIIMQMNGVSEDTKTIISLVGCVADIVLAFFIMECINQLSDHGYGMDNDEFKKLLIPFVGMALLAGGIGYYAETHLSDTLQKYIENMAEDDVVEEDSISVDDEEW